MAATTRKDWAQPQAGGQGFARTMKTFGRRVTVGTADDVANVVLGAFTVPPGFVVTGINVISSAFAAGLAFTIGDSGAPARYMASTGPGATSAALVPTALLLKLLVETEIQVVINTAASGNVAGTIDVYLTGFIDN